MKDNRLNNNKNPLFSIIMPVYNSEKWIKGSIESVLKQRYNNYELLIINDGSTDNSLSIINKYVNNNNTIRFINKKNEGATSARRTGLYQAKGRYIIFLDSDDRLTEDCLFRCKDIISLYNNLDCIYFEYYYKIENVLQQSKLSSLRYGYYDQNALNQHVYPHLYFPLQFNNALWTKVFRKEILKSCFDIPDDIMIGEDVIISYRAMELCNSMYFLNKPLYIYNTDNSKSLTHQYGDNLSLSTYKYLLQTHSTANVYYLKQIVNRYLYLLKALYIDKYTRESNMKAFSSIKRFVKHIPKEKFQLVNQISISQCDSCFMKILLLCWKKRLFSLSIILNRLFGRP